MGDVEASALVHSAIEDFAQELAHVTRRFLGTKSWEKTERIVVGGGFRDSRLGEVAIAPAILTAPIKRTGRGPCFAILLPTGRWMDALTRKNSVIAEETCATDQPWVVVTA